MRVASDKRKTRFYKNIIFIVVLLVGVLFSSCAANAPNAASTNLNKPRSIPPQIVASEYVKDIFSAHLAAASALILSSQRTQIIRVLALNSGSKSVASYQIRAGSWNITGDTSRVELIGTVCSTGSRTKSLKISGNNSTHSNSDCFTNTNPHSSNPAFRVNLKKVGDTWYVYFPAPPLARIPGTTAATVK